MVAYWGPELPNLDSPQARALIGAGEPTIGSNNIEPRPRVALLPEHRTGWTGRPGLSGSFAGVGWSPAFVNTDGHFDGAPVAGFRAGGAGRLEFRPPTTPGAWS